VSGRAAGVLLDGEGNRAGHRRFGNIRPLPSGRYQVSYLGLDGQRRYGPDTFERKSDAERFLALIEVQIYHGEWADPELWEGGAAGLRGEMNSAAARPSPAHVRPVLLAAPQAHRSLPRQRAAGQAVHGDDQAVAERAA